MPGSTRVGQISRNCLLKDIDRAIGDFQALRPGEPLDPQQVVDRAAKYNRQADEQRPSSARRLRVVK